MASSIETTAHALRKGSTDENEAFTGVLGELVADLGYEQNGVYGTDFNTTVRLHNGVNTGGIPLARADTRNIASAALAENRDLYGDKNLLYADMSNAEELTDSAVISSLVAMFNDYGLVTATDMAEMAETKANVTMDNVETSTLALGRGDGENGNLAYTDTTNVNTTFLASHTYHNSEDGNLPLAYYNCENVDTSLLIELEEDRPETMVGPVLTSNELLNVSATTWQNRLFDSENGLNLEVTTNKQTSIPEDNGEILVTDYPTSMAVKEYTVNTILGYDYLLSNFSNGSDYEALYSNNDYIYRYLIGDSQIVTAGTGFSVNDRFWLDKKLEYTTDEGQLMTQRTAVYAIFIEDIYVPENSRFAIVPMMGPTALPLDEGASYATVTVQDANGNQAAFKVQNVYNDEYQLYEYVAIDEQVVMPDVANFQSDAYYRCLENIYVDAYLTAIVESVDVGGTAGLGAITSCKIFPAYGNIPYPQEDITLLSPTGGTNADISFYSTELTTSGQAAGVAKTDLTNLKGMDDYDAFLEADSPWRIRHAEAFPELTDTEIADAEFYNIATVGAAWTRLRQVQDYLESLTARIDEMHIPSPQFFTSTGAADQTFELTDDLEFDFYINGLFQYPNSYEYDSETKTITVPWEIEETTENGILVVYRAYRK